MARVASQRAGNDTPCTDIVLKALTRLNEKATLKAASEELSIIIRALDHDNLAALVQSICTTAGAAEPKAVAKKECIRALAQLPLVSCPMSEVVLHQYMPKILSYLKKNLQDADGQVRDASCEALSAYAQALAEVNGAALPGDTSTPIVKAIFDCLAEQKKEGQMGASLALLKVSPHLAPLDRDLVKLILRLLKSPSFLGTAQLLAAVASTDAETHTAVGLLKRGAAVFLPYINHLIGQPPSGKGAAATAAYDTLGSGGGRSTSSAGGPPGRAPAGSGILGCLGSKDHAVRRAAADAVRAAVVLLGPGLEPDGAWGVGDAASITRRCMSALAECRFDKVKEPRDVARDAFNLLEQLHRFVGERGPDADWHQYATDALAYTGLLSPAACSPRSPTPPLAVRVSGGSFRGLRLQQSSPITQRFRLAAVGDDIVVQPGSRLHLSLGGGGSSSPGAAGDSTSSSSSGGSSPTQASAPSEPDLDASAGPGADGIDSPRCEPQLEGAAGGASSCHEQQQEQEQQRAPGQLRRQWSCSAGGAAPAPASRPSTAGSSSRPGSCNGSKGPGGHGAPSASASNAGSRRGSAAGARRTSSHSLPGAEAAAGAGAGIAVAAAGRPASSGGLADGGAAVPAAVAPPACAALPSGRHQLPSVPRGRVKAGGVGKGAAPAAPSWQGPTQQEWQQLQLQLAQCQGLVAQLQQEAAEQQQQHQSALQQLRGAHMAAQTHVELLQGRIAALEAIVQQQQQQQVLPPQQAPTPASGSRLGSTRSSSIEATTPAPAAAAAAAESAAAADATAAGAGPASAAVPEPNTRSAHHASRSSSFSRMYRSEDWSTPHASSASGGARRPSLLAADTPGSVGRSYGGVGAGTPGSLGGLRGCDVSTPGDLATAYADALRGDRSGVHLMRLIQKTGPVWAQLSPAVSADLLGVFTERVREGVMLHRVLPWLWRLADEDAVGHPEVPWEQRQQLLEALECCPAAEDPQVQEKVALLINTLKATWMPPTSNNS